MTSETLAIASFEIPQANGLRIRGEVRVLQDGRRKPVLVLGHGFRAHRLWSFWPDVARRFAEQGYYTVSFDFARIAAEEDRLTDEAIAQAATFGQELADWEAVVSRLRTTGLGLEGDADIENVAVLGHSRAAGSGVLFASREPAVRAVIAWNGGVSAPNAPIAQEGAKLTIREEAILADLTANADRYDVVGTYGDLDIPVLVVYGTADHERLLTAVNELQDAYPEQSFVAIGGADHSFNAKHPYEGFTKHLEDALDNSLRFLRRVFSSELNGGNTL
ncbi:alpha/beta hydrolase family protein [Cohnella yongneupensis]|uniref:Alpha/beta hydrolase family protein n=1 Tax=Cohnella yongneupensis TaxID=425006 RepID=A0ABW0R8D4_9BACL